MNDSPFWSTAVPRLLSSYAVLIFAVLWVGLAFAAAVNPTWLDQLWDWTRTLASTLQAAAWVFITPIMAGLWILNSSWTVIARSLAFAGLGGWTLLAVSSFVRAFR